VVTVGHGVDMAPTATPFDKRRGLLFVGALDPGSPNEDSVLFFARDVLPQLQDGRAPVVLTVVGSRVSTAVAALRSPTIEVFEQVDDLQPLFERARVFVAPTRFSAGIPLKLIDAASRMVPIVATSTLAEQLGWTNGHDLLAGDTAQTLASAIRQVYDDADTWERLRVSAFRRVGVEHSRDALASSIREMLSACGLSSPQAEQARKPANS
jgi:glycosyltransferase involved in cell wall biosynthesis